ncbi:hypothetical protein DFP72DRAFT_860118 [Ephemerocybe angulata]|uniref:Uncharacterized protein n=1 Tax=Ephemerocybe angulata TaxID=980116 RepID=A0A8H6HAV5_9AGAR|nr:hypothetical protein DFP72DRAFT_860118 [Tulosesus angulatus]
MKVSRQSFAIWNTSPIRDYGVVLTKVLETAAMNQVYALCSSLPPFEISTYHPYDFKLEVLAFVDWLVPTYYHVRHSLPREEFEFWILFAELVDIWSHVPFLRFRPDNFTRLARRIRIGSDLIPLSHVPEDRANISWRNAMDIDLHTERMIQCQEYVKEHENDLAWRTWRCNLDRVQTATYHLLCCGDQLARVETQILLDKSVV